MVGSGVFGQLFEEVGCGEREDARPDEYGQEQRREDIGVGSGCYRVCLSIYLSSMHCVSYVLFF